MRAMRVAALVAGVAVAMATGACTDSPASPSLSTYHAVDVPTGRTADCVSQVAYERRWVCVRWRITTADGSTFIRSTSL